MKFRIFAIIFALIFGLNGQSAYAAETNIVTKSALNSGTQKIPLGSNCYGHVHDPHNSKHDPSTINVVAETFCPGQDVYIVIGLARVKINVLGHFPIMSKVVRTKGKWDYGHVVDNVSMKCAVPRPRKEREYKVDVYHELKNGRHGYTGGSIKVVC